MPGHVPAPAVLGLAGHMHSCGKLTFVCEVPPGGSYLQCHELGRAAAAQLGPQIANSGSGGRLVTCPTGWSDRYT